MLFIANVVPDLSFQVSQIVSKMKMSRQVYLRIPVLFRVFTVGRGGTMYHGVDRYLHGVHRCRYEIHDRYDKPQTEAQLMSLSDLGPQRDDPLTGRDDGVDGTF